MSTMAFSSDSENTVPRPMPGDVSSVITGFWLTLGFSLLLIAALIPLAPRPISDEGSVTRVGWIINGGLALVVLLFGAFVGSGMRRGQPGALKLCKLGLLFFLVLDLAAITGIVVGLAMDKPEGASGIPVPLGPTPLLAMILLGFIVLMPVFFAILTYSMSSSMIVQEFFTPVEEEAQVSYGVEEAAGGAWAAGGAAAGAGAAAVMLDERPVVERSPLEEAYVEPPGEISSDAFDAALANEMLDEATVAYDPETGIAPAAEVMESSIVEAHPDVVEEVMAESVDEFEPGAEEEVMAEAEPEAEVEAEPLAEEDFAIFEGPAGADQGDSFIIKGPQRMTESMVDMEDPEAMDADIAGVPWEPGAGEPKSEHIKGPPVMTESQVEMMDVNPDDAEGTGIEPVDTWNFTEEPPKGDKKPKS